MRKTITHGIHLMISDFGRLMTTIGALVAVEKLHAMQAQIQHVLRKSMNGEETHGKIGQHAVVVDAAALLDQCMY